MNEIDLMKEHIKKRLGSNFPENLEFVLSSFMLFEYKKKHIILHYEEICNNVYFVCKGGIQVLYSDTSGNVWTRDLIFKDQWCCNLESFINCLPSNEEFKCIEDTTVLAINKNTFDNLLKDVPGFGNVFQQILTELYIENNNRIKYVLSQSAKNRIKWLYENKRELLNKVSSLVLASFLHINKDVFCRLRPQVLKELKI